ncbi:heparan-alpha-glucosaminide N-acetyltransferase domain-containing protein [Paenibacillus sp. NPDC057934]|uniref:heparan-alpha-glucosaminide N-acetyltransferase domain-containing protein n=1 Tax=Paenibacillus sp. NPDC057934 TaxID=3346282 RepID=UPI0036D802E1
MIDLQKVNNSGRQVELDIARGIAVIAMVLIHVLLEFGNTYATDESIYGKIVQFFGGVPAAPVFMFLLGAGVIYSRKNTPAVLARRGLILLLFAYLLNLLRSVIPSMINGLSAGQTVMEQFPLLYGDLLYVDILQFAGLAMLYFALALKLKLTIRGHVMNLLFFMLINDLVSPFAASLDNLYISPIVALLFGNELSYFPFFVWIVYPIGGCIFATFLIQTKNKKRLYRSLLKISSTILVGFAFLAIAFGFPTGYESDADYYNHNMLVSAFFSAFIVFWISCIYFVSSYLIGQKFQFFKSASALTTQIYVIHFLLIGIYMVFIHRKLGLEIIVPLSIATYLFSHCTSYLYVRLRRYFV